MQYIYDDGSTLTQDSAGNVTAVTNNQGEAVMVSGGFGQQVQNLLTYGVRAAIDNKYRAQEVNRQVQAQQAAVQQGINPTTLLILAAVALLAFKTLAK